MCYCDIKLVVTYVKKIYSLDRGDDFGTGRGHEMRWGEGLRVSKERKKEPGKWGSNEL